jgi:rod shape-determining protein MreB
MVVDIGGGTTDVAVISLGSTVVSASIKVAGDNFDESIIRYMRRKHNLLIGERSAEDLKINIGTAFPRTVPASMDVRGRNLVTGLPRTICVTSDEMLEALNEAVTSVVEAVHMVLEKTPPELASDISDRGIVMTGGGSLLYGLDKLLKDKSGINTIIAEDAISCVATGTGKYIEYVAQHKINAEQY